MWNKYISFALLKEKSIECATFSELESVIIYMRTPGPSPDSGLFIGLIQRRTITSRLHSQMTSVIFYDSSATVFVGRGGGRTEPRTARGHVNAARQSPA